MLDPHILDCEICQRVYKLVMDHESEYLPTTLEEIIKCSYEEYISACEKITPLEIPSTDYDHVMQAGPPSGPVKLVRVSLA